MVTKKAKLVDAEGAPVAAEPESSGLAIPEIPLSVFVDVGRLGFQLGIGLMALAYDAAHKVMLDAIDRGAKIEKNGLDALGKIERDQILYMKDYLQRMKGKAEKASGSAIEAHVEEALKTHDVPTRDDIRELNELIASVDAKVTKLHHHK
jgi:polyhydroxyalkanoate synthesis regulator phasin